jgi:hypothetical protein
VRQYGHFRCPDGFWFSQPSPPGDWTLGAPIVSSSRVKVL